MTREEKLYSMTGNTLLGVAEKLGLNVNKNILKQGKGKLIEKIMEVEKNQIETQAEDPAISTAEPSAKLPIEAPQEPIEVVKHVEVVETKAVEKKAPKKTNLKLTTLTYKGETKSIKDWAADINMPWPTLYDRVNRNGWPVDLAIETPLGQRRHRQ